MCFFVCWCAHSFICSSYASSLCNVYVCMQAQTFVRYVYIWYLHVSPLWVCMCVCMHTRLCGNMCAVLSKDANQGSRFQVYSSVDTFKGQSCDEHHVRHETQQLCITFAFLFHLLFIFHFINNSECILSFPIWQSFGHIHLLKETRQNTLISIATLRTCREKMLSFFHGRYNAIAERCVLCQSLNKQGWKRHFFLVWNRPSFFPNLNSYIDSQ